MESVKRYAGIAASLISVLGVTVIAAPAASATPSGCGDLENGQLCITGGKVGVHGTFTWTVGYSRSKSGQITVTLGDQRKNSKITALPTYYGSVKTNKTANYAQLSNKHGIDAGDCIRGIMEYKGKTYVTKWRCP
ncbi:hypothetical protein [Streptomyces misionensis]|uniref:hypothetical protein n=1 Tax=Streptomyces misionensis TaxID=67331 RepID=UPI003681725B